MPKEEGRTAMTDPLDALRAPVTPAAPIPATLRANRYSLAAPAIEQSLSEEPIVILLPRIEARRALRPIAAVVEFAVSGC